MLVARIPAERLVRLLGDWQDGRRASARALQLALAEVIEGAHLPAGQQMPGQRDLAEALSIARGTVARTYAALVETGHLSARHGSGTVVRHPRQVTGQGEGRLTSFDDGGARPVLDLSSGALPGSQLLAGVLPEVGRLLGEHHLDEAGYHPAGLRELRTAVAMMTTEQGLPTGPEEVMITAGSQQAVWLLATALTGPGSLVVTEDPTYRGALEAFAGTGARLQGVPLSPAGVDTDLLGRAARRADLVYLQPSLHNPTGVHSSSARRQQIAEALAGPALVVDDQSSADLSWTRSDRLPGLERVVDPDRLLVVGTLSKVFWGGIRVGWIRGPRALVARLTDLRRSLDLAGSVLDQLAAVLLLPQIGAQRAARGHFLADRFSEVSRVLTETLPEWRWWLPAGGSGLWVDTGTDAVALAQAALGAGVRLTTGPAFSPHDGHRQFLRLPVWHPVEELAEALETVAALG